MSPRGGKRVGAGRPKGRSAPAIVSVRVEKGMLDGLQRVARTKGISVSERVRSAVARLVRQLKGHNRRSSAPRPR
jgi:hypothetical protein